MKIILIFFPAFSCKNKDAISAYFSQTQDAAYDYYRPLVDGCRKVLAVDLGWNGTCAIALKYLLEEKKQTGVQVLSALLGAKDGQEPTVRMAAGDLFVYGFAGNLNRDLQKNHMGKDVDYHNLLMEMMFTAPEQSFLKFCYENDRLSWKNEKSSESFYIGLERFHNGMLQFVSLWKECSKISGSSLSVASRDCILPIQMQWADRDTNVRLLKKQNVQILPEFNESESRK